jgi:hypothetical protein
VNHLPQKLTWSKLVKRHPFAEEAKVKGSKSQIYES